MALGVLTPRQLYMGHPKPLKCDPRAYWQIWILYFQKIPPNWSEYNKLTRCSRGPFFFNNLLISSSVSYPFVQNPKPEKLGSWNFERMFTPHHVSYLICHMSCVTCYVLHVICQLSCVRCHVLDVKCHNFIFYIFLTKWRS